LRRRALEQRRNPRPTGTTAGLAEARPPSRRLAPRSHRPHSVRDVGVGPRSPSSGPTSPRQRPSTWTGRGAHSHVFTPPFDAAIAVISPTPSGQRPTLLT